MKSFLTLLALAAICLPGKSYGQLTGEQQSLEVISARLQASQVISPAPEAAELGKYGNTPVNLSTGCVNISIPLFELKGKELSLPISLSFNASGFKPQDKPTWVGQGWSLNAGGVITRSVRGNPDNYENYFSRNRIPLSNSYWSYLDYIRNIKYGYIETQPDLYFYNFNGHSGGFCLGRNAIEPQILKQEEDMIKIVYNSLSSFNITDLQGVQYVFDQQETGYMQYNFNVESGSEPPRITTYTYPSAWYVSSMKSADGREELKFEYYSTAMYDTSPENPMSEGVSRTYSTSLKFVDGIPQPNENTVSGTRFSSPLSTTKSNRKFLKKITLYRDNIAVAYVDFISDTQREDAAFPEERVLREVKLYSLTSGQPELIKDVVLGYGYYAAEAVGRKRLRLDSVQELAVAAGTADKPPYRFQYYADLLPAFSTYAIDHWGFYNSHGNASAVPTATIEPPFEAAVNTIGLGAIRTPSLSGAQSGMIKRIDYPTGGYSTYAYELHDSYNSRDNTTRSVGGVRIKEMVDYSAVDKPAIIKSYTYRNENNMSSGVTDDAYPVYLDKSTWTPGSMVGLPKNGLFTISRTTFTITGNAVYGLGSFPGGHIGYTMVTEQSRTTSNKYLGKTVYNYRFGTPSQYRNNIANGELVAKSVYDEDGVLLQQTTYTYAYPESGGIEYIDLRPQPAQSNKIRYYFTSESDYTVYTPYETRTDTSAIWKFATIPVLYNPQNYLLSSQKRQLLSVVNKTLDKQSKTYIKDSTANEYTSLHIFPVKTYQTSSGTDMLVTHKKYVADGVALVPETGYEGLFNNNMLSAETEIFQYREDINHNNQRLVGGRVTYYGSNFKPVRQFQMEIPSALPLASFVELTSNGGQVQKDPHYKPALDFFYKDGNLATHSKTGDVSKSYTWDYGNLFPTAEVANSDANSIAYTSFETVGAASGNWQFANVTVASGDAYTGSKAGLLNSTSSISKSFQPAIQQDVTVSFWAKNSNISVFAGSIVLSNLAPAVTRNGWTYYEYKAPAGSQLLTITGAGLIDELRCYPVNGNMTSYTYKPFVGMTSANTSQNQKISYEYDGLNRLTLTRDGNGNILQQIQYSYGTENDISPAPKTIFYNAALGANFQKSASSCIYPMKPEPINYYYSVPANSFTSLISQEDADAKALAELNLKGQQNADNLGTCYYFNNPLIDSVTNSCGRKITVYVSEGEVKSLTSQADADAQAATLLAQRRTAAAASTSPCPCDELGEAYKFIRNKCEKGRIIYTSSVPASGGGYTCTFHYLWTDNSTSRDYTIHSNTACVLE